MRSPSGETFLRARFLVPAILAWCLNLATCGAGLEVMPSSTSNTYSGPLTLRITGIAEAESVVIQRYLDTNNSGTVDGGDLLVQNLPVTDGQIAEFGGVRNRNIPGDEDLAANGQIDVVFSFDAAPEIARGAGNQLYRVVSPTGSFTSVVQPWEVTQAPFAQGVTGQVTSGGSPVPRAWVALLIQVGEDAEFVLGGQTDATGHFSLNAAPGPYLLLAIKPGFVLTFDDAPFIFINPGEMLTQDVVISAATRTISGRFTDPSSGVGIPGLQLFVESDNDEFTIVFTDENGDFTAGVLPGEWEISGSEVALLLLGYLFPESVSRIDTTAGDVAGLSMEMPRATALVYGNLRTDDGTPVADVSIFARDDSNQYSSGGTTDSAGDYTVGVLAGSWYVSPGAEDPALAGYVIQSANVSVTSGAAVQADIVLQAASSHLTGRVIDESGAPVADVQIYAFSLSGSGANSSLTDASGRFDVAVFAGTWQLQVDSESAVERGLVVPHLEFTVADNETISDITYLASHASASISGSVITEGGTGLSGVNVVAFSQISGTSYSSNARTDVSGFYALGVIDGTWQVGVNCDGEGGLTSLGYTCPDTLAVTVSGSNVFRDFVVRAFTDAPPQLGRPIWFPGGVQFEVTGESGRSYRVEATSAFDSWIPIVTNRAFGGSFFVTDTASPGVQARFYRAVLVP